MPPSALHRLASLHVEYPMLFELTNAPAERISHCGVLEFVADEGLIYVPYWMMENMLLQEGDIVQVKNASLPKGTYVKLQPHANDFLDISNPKAILETALRNYSCLTIGDTIMVPYNNKKYYINIVETKPTPAVSIIETDCEVDFAPPLDCKEPEKPAPSLRSNNIAPKGFSLFFFFSFFSL
ncbi:ubiquitin recognition factor in ER-associated degradation protein 1-like [Durio zibethinus]|uniref:Ubiquitin recognition factor in ER-associated degradation protein 1-like n=1 Tax=Durio zibethinus TaxID=66656 RepID=A0A6P5ZK53_DURZI|nr:ubiquitin recognition factor in ER-associated degradation protein 1-like [Durio zibethinus]